ncbi:MAG: sugar ABC transporter permease [Treponema sp.]|jgi:multiple sugar transport system permease protein|nr:sugar ABC transporter permease [Treponema sp.]
MKKIKGSGYADNVSGWLSVLPVIVLELLIFAYPVFTIVTKSFTNWDGLFRNDFVGLRNYLRIIQDGDFWLMLQNTGILLVTIPLHAIIGVIIAVQLNERIRGWKFFRFVYYLPSIVSMLTVGYLFRVFFSYTGPLNRILQFMGLDFLALEWLGIRPAALGVVVLCLLWSNLGWQVLIIFGGLTAIHTSIFEAAIMDGAGYWRRLFKIVFPLLLRTIEYSIIMTMLWIFTGVFPLILSLTGGGPGYGTTTLDYMIYKKGFTGTQLGQACTLAVVLLIIILIITKLQMVMADNLDDWGE